MSEFEDFDIAALASYLHITPAQVQKLADRGRLPGRRINGQWRFSRAEIHHWFEDRIGASDENELVKVEEVLNRQSSAAGDDVSLADLLSLETIAVPLAARTKNSVIDSMCEMSAACGRLWDAQAMAEAIRARESLHPTALDIGVALLHPRRPLPNLIDSSFLAIGITQTGIPFGGPRGALTDVFFLIASYSEQEHLRILARLSRLVIDASFLTGLRAAGTAADALDVVRLAEGGIT